MDRCIWWKIAGWYLGVFGWKSIHSQLLVFEQMSDNSCISKAGYMPNWLSLCAKCSTMVAHMRLKRIVNIYCKPSSLLLGSFSARVHHSCMQHSMPPFKTWQYGNCILAYLFEANLYDISLHVVCALSSYICLIILFIKKNEKNKNDSRRFGFGTPDLDP